jgi:hypothetical protein
VDGGIEGIADFRLPIADFKTGCGSPIGNWKLEIENDLSFLPT